MLLSFTYEAYTISFIDLYGSHRINAFFTARCNRVQRALLRLHVVCLTVCPSARDVGGPGPHRLEILETNCTDN